MKWIEQIVVRSLGNGWKTLKRRFIAPLLKNHGQAGIKEIILYRNAFVESDVCIHIHWELEVREPGKSDFGVGLAASLEEYGRVHHTIWIEEE